MQRLILNQDDNNLCVGSLCTGNGISGLLGGGVGGRVFSCTTMGYYESSFCACAEYLCTSLNKFNLSRITRLAAKLLYIAPTSALTLLQPNISMHSLHFALYYLRC